MSTDEYKAYADVLAVDLLASDATAKEALSLLKHVRGALIELVGEGACEHCAAADALLALHNPLDDAKKETSSMSTCWLIERGQRVNHVPTVWWAGKPKWDHEWTQDANKATKFATKELAEEQIESMSRPVGERMQYATEHVFLEDTP